MFEDLKYLYDIHKLTQQDLKHYVLQGHLTKEQYKEITGREL